MCISIYVTKFYFFSIDVSKMLPGYIHVISKPAEKQISDQISPPPLFLFFIGPVFESSGAK